MARGLGWGGVVDVLLLAVLLLPVLPVLTILLLPVLPVLLLTLLPVLLVNNYGICAKNPFLDTYI